MAYDAHANLATSFVVTAPSPATSGTSLVVVSGNGARFPAVPFNATVGPPNTVLTPANSEIVRVTARSTDTLTITRAQEGTTARSIAVGDIIFAGPTVKTFTDIETDAAAATASLAAGFPLGTGAWSTYTPTWTQSVTITKTVNEARYIQIGKLVVAKVVLTSTGAGTANNAMVVSLPVTSVATSGGAIGSFFFNSTGVAFWAGSVHHTSTTTVQFIVGGSSAAFAGQTAGGFTSAVKSGDGLTFIVTYEAA